MLIKPCRTINIIVAMDPNRVIGYKGQLPWKIKEDMQSFKRITKGDGNNSVIMGRKTWYSIQEKPLPDRYNIVIGSNIRNADGVYARSTIEDGIVLALRLPGDVFVIGGAGIYTAAMPYVDRLIVSHITQEYPGDTHFPIINPNEWRPITTEDYAEFQLVTYEKNPSYRRKRR